MGWMQSNTMQCKQHAQWNAPSGSCIPALPGSLTYATCTRSQTRVCIVPQLPQDRQDCVCNRQCRMEDLGHIHCSFAPRPVPARTHPVQSDTGAALNDAWWPAFGQSPNRHLQKHQGDCSTGAEQPTPWFMGHTWAPLVLQNQSLRPVLHCRCTKNPVYERWSRLLRSFNKEETQGTPSHQIIEMLFLKGWATGLGGDQ